MLVIGRKEQGKTTLAYSEARRSPTVLIFDPREFFSKDSRQIEAEDHGVDLYEELDTLSRVVVHPGDNVIESFEETCSTFKDWLRDNPAEPVSFLVDEALFIKPTSDITGPFGYIIRCTAAKRVKIILTAHRPGDIAVGIRGLSDFWCIFHTTQEHDLEVIAERCGDETALEVQNLKLREFVVWNDGRAKMHVNREPSSWKVSLDEPSAVGQHLQTVANSVGG